MRIEQQEDFGAGWVKEAREDWELSRFQGETIWKLTMVNYAKNLERCTIVIHSQVGFGASRRRLLPVIEPKIGGVSKARAQQVLCSYRKPPP